ncbi:MAG: hypothetical protein LBH35_00125 [Treponema sp.]|jgi:hypothetical protein|nr:hypothetical protein [Treponema sp.]
MKLEELKEKRKKSIKALCTLGVSALPKEFWGVDTNIFRGTGLDNGFLGIILRIVSFLLLTIPFMIIMFIINFFKLIYYQIEISKLNK